MNKDSATLAFLRGLTVLYVEDDPVISQRVAIFLRRRVGNLLMAANGQAGLAAFLEAQPAIVITDVQMPGMDGLSMLEEIRKTDSTIPIIITTAFEQTDYMLKAIKLKVDRYVVKPIEPVLMEEALLTCAHRLSLEHQARKAHRLEHENAELRHQAALRVLFGGIAHDFNNLLQSIVCGITLAKMEVHSPGAVLLDLEMTDAAIAQSMVLSNRLILLANATDRLAMAGPLDSPIRQGVERALEGSDIRVELNLGGTWPVNYNHANLALVFQSLATNARESMGQHGVLRISTTPEEISLTDSPGILARSYVQIRVEDTGGGIAEDVLPMIFEPYFSTKDRGSQRGMGLGLALCQAVILAHGGKISVESKPGEGATFVIHLPLATTTD